MLIHRGLSRTRGIMLYKFVPASRRRLNVRSTGETFFALARARGKKHGTTVSHSLVGFRRAFGQTPLGFRICVQKRTTSRPTSRAYPSNPSVSGLLVRPARNGRRDKPRHKRKLSSTTRHGNRVAGRGVATREERSGRFIFQKGAERPKIYVYSHLLTRPTVFLRASYGETPGDRGNEPPFLPGNRTVADGEINFSWTSAQRDLYY